MRSRFSISTLPSNLKKNIENCFGINESTQPQVTEEVSTNKRKICSFCHYKKRRITKVQSTICKKHICGEHQIITCPLCSSK